MFQNITHFFGYFFTVSFIEENKPLFENWIFEKTSGTIILNKLLHEKYMLLNIRIILFVNEM